MGAHVHQDRGIDMTAADREVVHTQHLHRGDRHLRYGPDQPQQRVPAHHDPQGSGQPRCGPAGQRQPEGGQDLTQQRRVAGMRSGQTLHLLGERHRRAGGVGAAKPSDQQLDHHGGATQRDIVQASNVPAVHPVGERAAARARHRRGTRVHTEPKDTT
jgi:hypothetical protein